MSTPSTTHPATTDAGPSASPDGSNTGHPPQGDLAGSVQELAGQAQERAQDLAEQARRSTREQVDQRSSELGQRANGAASDLRSVAEQLRAQGKDHPAQLAEQAAERVARVGEYLERSDGQRILHDVEQFGRQRPWAVAAGGLAVGLAASRVLKASSGERYRSRTSHPAGKALAPTSSRGNAASGNKGPAGSRDTSGASSAARAKGA